MTRLRAPRGLDGGFTLTELLAYMVLFGILGTMVVTLLWSGFKTQINVTKTTESTGELNNAAIAIDNDVRNATVVSVTESGKMLRVRTWAGDVGTAGSFVCRGWFYDSSAHVLRYTTKASSTNGATTSSATSWKIYASDVLPVTGVAPFEALGTPVNSVRVTFKSDPAPFAVGSMIDTTILKRPQGTTVSTPCF